MTSMKLRFDPVKRVWSIQRKRDSITRYQEIRGEVLALRANELYLEKERVPRELLLFGESQHQRVDAVASLELESYLSGVLPSEMPAAWPLAALKAQAVASRTYALYKKNQRPGARFHVVGSVLDQVFNYENSKALPLQHANNVERALLETRGMILRNSRQQPLQAFYHASCGGRTEAAQRIWKTAGRIPSVADPHCRVGKHSSWQRRITFSELGRKLKVKSEIKKVHVLSHTESGRIHRIALEKKSGAVQKMSANDFRKKLGYSRVKSTFFAIHNRSDHVHLKGRGFGHGAGLCQWGARGMSMEGKNFAEILTHYYPNAKLGPYSRRVANL